MIATTLLACLFALASVSAALDPYDEVDVACPKASIDAAHALPLNLPLEPHTYNASAVTSSAQIGDLPLLSSVGCTQLPARPLPAAVEHRRRTNPYNEAEGSPIHHGNDELEAFILVRCCATMFCAAPGRRCALFRRVFAHRSQTLFHRACVSSAARLRAFLPSERVPTAHRCSLCALLVSFAVALRRRTTD